MRENSTTFLSRQSSYNGLIETKERQLTKLAFFCFYQLVA